MTQPKRIRKREEALLFWKSLMKNPRNLGAIAPSSPALGELICKHLDQNTDGWIIEIGAGTGRFTQAMLKSGIAKHRLLLVELEPELCVFLKKHFPDVTVIEGDASNLESVLPPEIIGHVSTIVSGIPLVSLSPEVRDAVVKSCFQVMEAGGVLLQFTYSPVSPIPATRLGLKKRRLGQVLLNLPPAVVWAYTREV